MAHMEPQPARCKEISEQCMLKSPVGSCGNDLKCICEIDAKLETNCVFSNECLWKECTNEDGRKVFMKDWIDSCEQVGKSGLDYIPQRWAPYVHHVIHGDPNTPGYQPPPEPTPTTKTSLVAVFTSTAAIATSLPASNSTLHTTSSSTKAVASSLQSTISTSPTSASPEIASTAPKTAVVASKTLSPGAIGGIVTGILLLAILCAGLGFYFWKAHKKTKEKNREVAILSDQVSGQGFQRYIDELMADSNSSNNTMLRRDETGHATRGGAGPTVSTERVMSQSSSLYSDDVARAL